MPTHNIATNGTATVNGRGIKHRKLDREGRVYLAAAVVSGARPFTPSFDQASLIFDVPRHLISECVKTHSEWFRTWNGHREETLAEHLARSTPAELIEAARARGIDW